ncbi:hypothetical protein QWZ10_04865 [Paracoccus cavernae]|uniref:Uncharacterized protein n=1 Tax=Paracoccus cavernae TaxID=1571207 RepID=A0ABT8D4C0_9RHOB|nr:hypothetical protein [Paracoccus cavernae]
MSEVVSAHIKRSYIIPIINCLFVGKKCAPSRWKTSLSEALAPEILLMNVHAWRHLHSARFAENPCFAEDFACTKEKFGRIFVRQLRGFLPACRLDPRPFRKTRSECRLCPKKRLA